MLERLLDDGFQSHPVVASSLHWLGIISQERGLLNDAERFFSVVLRRNKM